MGQVEYAKKLKQRERLHSILDKHVLPDDEKLSDREFVENIVKRFYKHMEGYIIDVNE